MNNSTFKILAIILLAIIAVFTVKNYFKIAVITPEGNATIDIDADVVKPESETIPPVREIGFKFNKQG